MYGKGYWIKSNDGIMQAETVTGRFEFCDIVSVFSCTSSFIVRKCLFVSDVTMSCGCHTVVPNNIASIVVALVPMYGEYWLVYSYQLFTIAKFQYVSWLVERSEEVEFCACDLCAL